MLSSRGARLGNSDTAPLRLTLLGRLLGAPEDSQASFTQPVYGDELAQGALETDPPLDGLDTESPRLLERVLEGGRELVDLVDLVVLAGSLPSADDL